VSSGRTCGTLEKMNRKAHRVCLLAVVVAGCASNPPARTPAAAGTWEIEPPAAAQDQWLALADPAATIAFAPQAPAASARETYQFLASRPPAQSRSLHIRLDSQAFEYFEDGEVLLAGPIASGKADAATPTGRFAVLSKDKDKVSSRYTNEIGTQAWMPYSLQFHGNYFIHEGWLPGYPASHGCVRLGHYDARLLFERMRVGDPVTVTR